jgi:LAO/AO transport system kinase
VTPDGIAVRTPAPASLHGRRGRRAVDVPDLVARARGGEARAVARLISLVEDASPALREVAAALAPHTGHARVIGLTGAPGVGKSTTTTALVRAYRARGLRVGVLAVDPSSPFSGGALLGDRVRMQDHAGDDGVYIRSMASRGHLGGLAWATPQALRVLDAAGCDVVLVETVGVGQSELEVASLADTTLVLLAPGMGDGIQAAKAGILEVADVLVVNKADRDGADQTVRDLRYTLSLSGRRELAGGWRPPIRRTVAATGTGVDALVDTIGEHRDWLASSGEGHRRRTVRAAREIEAIAVAALRERMGDVRGSAALGALAEQVVAGGSDPFRAADTLLGQL